MKKVLVPLLGCVVIGLVSCGSDKKDQKTFNEIFDFAPIATSIQEVKVTHGPGQLLPLQEYDLNYSKDEAYFKQIEEYAKKLNSQKLMKVMYIMVEIHIAFLSVLILKKRNYLLLKKTNYI